MEKKDSKNEIEILMLFVGMGEKKGKKRKFLFYVIIEKKL